MILAGDLTGKLIIPVVEQAPGSYKCHFLGRDVLADEAGLKGLERKIRDSGFYPYVTNPNEKAELDANPSKVDELFSQHMLKTAQEWMELVEERLAGMDVKCFIMPGNDDRMEIDTVFKKSSRVINPNGVVVAIDKAREMISAGYSNITPWKCPRDIPEEKLAEIVEAMASQVKDMASCIFNFHCPPYDSGLDTAPKLDSDLKPVFSMGGEPAKIAAGSVAIRDAIAKYQPLLGLHGHIHESRGFAKIGRTLCMNPGSEYTEGILRGAIVNLDEKGIKSYSFTSG